MKVYYIIPLNYRLTKHPEILKIKLYYFPERWSLRYNIILKLLSLFHIYIFGEITNFQKDLILKSILKMKIFYFTFYFIDHSAYDQLLPPISKIKSKNVCDSIQY